MKVVVSGQECEVVVDGDGVWVREGLIPVWEELTSARVVKGVHDKEREDVGDAL